MGMFDTVRFTCPGCDSFLYEQSKAGNCHMTDFDEDQVPMKIAEDLKGQELHCEKCSRAYVMEISSSPPETVAMHLRRSR